MENSPLALFEHEKFGSLRVVRSDQGAQWFVAKDVCGCLGLDTSNLSKMLDEDELSTYPVQYTDQVRNLSVVSEPGLYSLILRSRKPEAKAFKRWVTHEVIPSIRKVGGYLIAKPDDTPRSHPRPRRAGRAGHHQAHRSRARRGYPHQGRNRFTPRGHRDGNRLCRRTQGCGS